MKLEWHTGEYFTLFDLRRRHTLEDDHQFESWAGFYEIDGKYYPYHYKKPIHNIEEAKKFCEKYARKRLLAKAQELQEVADSISS